MLWPLTVLRRLWNRRYEAIYVFLAGWFVVTILSARDPYTGFTSLIVFGDRFARLERLHDLPIHVWQRSDGYDGQFYAQIAVVGNPFDHEIGAIVDAPAYRGRRVLLPLTAHLAGFGQPAWILSAYALSNLFCWVLLALAMARWWFPPVSLDNLVRWGGTLFGVGMMVSVTRSLTDGPTLLLIALAVRCVELNRHRLAAAILAAAGLVRETSILTAGVFIPSIGSDRRQWRKSLSLVLVTVAPVVLWTGVLSVYYGPTNADGNLALPLQALLGRLVKIYQSLGAGGSAQVPDEIYVVVALVVQVAVVVGRPNPGNAWWRVGTGFAALACLLSWRVWDDPLIAISRNLLPLTLAFNVLAPRSRRGLVLLLLGNLTVLSAPKILGAVPWDTSVAINGIVADYASGWHAPESDGGRRWRWASGSATLGLHNSGQTPTRVSVEFEISSPESRAVTARCGGLTRMMHVGADRIRVTLLCEVPPGDTPLLLDTVEPPWVEPGPHGRPLTFGIEKLTLRMGVRSP